MKSVLLSKTSATYHVYHGGTFDGRGDSRILYTSPNKDLAESYVSMSRDRFDKGKLLELTITLDHPAPENVVMMYAKDVGIDPEECLPASIFDRELWGNKVDRLREALIHKGYDGAILDDIGYGVQIQDKAYILFRSSQAKLASHKTTPNQETPTFKEETNGWAIQLDRHGDDKEIPLEVLAPEMFKSGSGDEKTLEIRTSDGYAQGFLTRDAGEDLPELEGKLVAYLAHVAVKPAARRRGVGSSLVEEFLESAKMNGAEACYLNAATDNPNMTREGLEKFYLGLGFQLKGGSRMMKKLAVSEQNRQLLTIMGNDILEDITLGEYDFMVVECRLMPGMYQLGMIKSGENFLDQEKKPSPRGSGSFSVLKTVIKNWLQKYGRLYAVSHNPEHTRRYVSILKRLGYKVDYTIVMGIECPYIDKDSTKMGSLENAYLAYLLDKSVTAGEEPVVEKKTFQGLPIHIEFPKGSIRHDKEMLCDYGFLPGTSGLGDNEAVDIFLGPEKNAPYAYVVEQLKEDGSFDEYKTLLGFNSLEEAEAAYLAQYDEDWKDTRVESITEFPTEEFVTIAKENL